MAQKIFWYFTVAAAVITALGITGYSAVSVNEQSTQAASSPRASLNPEHSHDLRRIEQNHSGRTAGVDNVQNNSHVGVHSEKRNAPINWAPLHERTYKSLDDEISSGLRDDPCSHDEEFRLISVFHDEVPIGASTLESVTCAITVCRMNIVNDTETINADSEISLSSMGKRPSITLVRLLQGGGYQMILYFSRSNGN